MNILVIGASGFVGKNLCGSLKNIRDGKDRTRSIKIDEIYEFGDNIPNEYLEEYCKRADCVFDFSGASIIEGDSSVIDMQNMLSSLKACKNACPVVIFSLNHSTIAKESSDFLYSQSVQANEELAFEYSKDTGATVIVYRSPSIFGKWCKPNSNSIVATFCYNVANDLPLQSDENEAQLELAYIDDFVDDMLSMLENGFADISEPITKKSGYCVAKTVHNVTAKGLKALLCELANQPKTLIMPEIPNGSFEKKLYSTYLSYLPKDKVSFPLKMNVDARGSFTELIKSKSCGQVSVNISKPGITKGQHWHNTKWEFFIVVGGHGLIQMRKIGSDEVLSFEVSGEKIEAIHMLPGYTHNIINLSETEDLITVMWANEEFNPQKPDTFGEPV